MTAWWSGRTPFSWLWGNQRLLFRAFLVLFVAATALRLCAIKAVPLAPEEAYYWDYSQHPNLSYFDHPPMVAWMIRFGTAVFGDTELGVRWVSSILMLGACTAIYFFARVWWARQTAILSAAALLLLPGYFISGLMGTMEAPLVLFWAMTLLFLSRALHHDQPANWYLAGITTGLALLAKYTAIFLPLGGVLAVVLYKPWRRQLRTIHPYIACIIAIALFSPVLLWNARHGFASFRFQLYERSALTRLSLALPALFIAYQFLIVGPVHALAAVVALRRYRRFSPALIIAASLSLPLIAAMFFKSFREAHPSWTLPAYLALLPLATQLLVVESRWLHRRAKKDSGALGITAIACLSAYVGLFLFLIVLQPRLLLIRSFGQWRNLAAIVERYEDQLPHHPGQYAETEPFVVGDGPYRLAAELAFYRTPIEHEYPASASTTSRWPIRGDGRGYEYWLTKRDLLGRDCVFVTDDPDNAKKLAPHFELIEPKESAPLSRRKTYYVYICRNYLG